MKNIFQTKTLILMAVTLLGACEPQDLTATASASVQKASSSEFCIEAKLMPDGFRDLEWRTIAVNNDVSFDRVVYQADTTLSYDNDQDAFKEARKEMNDQFTQKGLIYMITTKNSQKTPSILVSYGTGMMGSSVNVASLSITVSDQSLVFTGYCDIKE